MNSLEVFGKQYKLPVVFSGFLLIAIIGFIDHITGHELEFSIFYLIPVYLIIWVTDQWSGFVLPIASAIILLLIDVASGRHNLYSLVLIWNSLIRILFFIIITLLLSSLKRALLRERELSRTDHLTSATNLRRFRELLQMEIHRFERYRHPFTIAYIDIDDFKKVNDQFGHAKGDLALQTLASTVRSELRKSDLFARIGGDEFTILFPETDQESANRIIENLRGRLSNDMQKINLSVTFSIGAVTFLTTPQTTDELLILADEVMYSTKMNGKNAVRHTIYKGESDNTASFEKSSKPQK